MKRTLASLINLQWPRWQWLLLLTILAGLNSAQFFDGCDDFMVYPSSKEINPRDTATYNFNLNEPPYSVGKSPCEGCVVLTDTCGTYATVLPGSGGWTVTANKSMTEGKCTLTATAIYPKDKKKSPEFRSATIEFKKVPLKLLQVLGNGTVEEADALTFVPIGQTNNYQIEGGVRPYTLKIVGFPTVGGVPLRLERELPNNTMQLSPTYKMINIAIISDAGEPKEKVAFTAITQ